MTKGWKSHWDDWHNWNMDCRGDDSIVPVSHLQHLSPLQHLLTILVIEENSLICRKCTGVLMGRTHDFCNFQTVEKKKLSIENDK